MRKVERRELIDYVTYNEGRDAFREKVMAEKALRRIHVGPYMTFLFENPLTVRYQVQEMMRAEQLVKEAEIQHELSTYNELLGDDGEIGCTLLIEIDDPATRAEKLSAWLKLPEHLFVKLADGKIVRATFDPRQVGDDRLSSVQYLKFPIGDQLPVLLGCDLPGAEAVAELTKEQQQALRSDLLS